MRGTEFERMGEPTPVFLIGAARSGTKYLRDVLAAADCVKAVPYDVNYVWRYCASEAPSDVLDPEDLTDKRIRFIRKTLRDLAKAGPGDILLEKTVSNSLRVPFVDRVFPDARYVHLVRDGRAVAESAMRQWQAPPDWLALWKKLRDLPLANIGYVGWFGGNLIKGLVSGRGGGGVWGPRFDGIEAMTERDGLAAVCAWQWRESVERASADLAELPGAERRVFEIRYEDLVSGDAALEQLISGLSLPDGAQILAAHRARMRPGPADRWQSLTLTDQGVITEIVSDTLLSKGYAS